jgi:hypothetical protein
MLYVLEAKEMKMPRIGELIELYCKFLECRVEARLEKVVPNKSFEYRITKLIGEPPAWFSKPMREGAVLGMVMIGKGNP